MTRKVDIKTLPQSFWLDDTELPDPKEMVRLIDKYMDVDGDILAAVDESIREYKQHQKSREITPTLRAEIDDLTKIIEAVDELDTRLDRLPPKTQAMVEYIDAGTVSEARARLKRLDNVLVWVNQEMTKYAEKHKETKPKLLGRDRLVCVLSGLYETNTEIRDPGDRREFINAMLGLADEEHATISESALTKILRNAPP